jgi:hypothetical protein
LAMIGLLFALFLLSTVLHSVPRAWKLLGVQNSGPLSFGDLRVITYSVECAHGGGDPYTVNGCDTYWTQHPDPSAPSASILYNYPPIWLKSWRVGLLPAATNSLGILFAVLTFTAFALMFRPQTAVGGVLTIAAVLSPSILLGIERGNSDLMIFSLLVLALLATARLSEPLRVAIRACVIIMLTVLKLFPIACIALFARTLKGWAIAIFVAIVAAILTVWAGGHRLLDVFHNTPVFASPTFGALSIFLGWNGMLRLNADPAHLRLAALIIALLAAGTASYWAASRPRFALLPSLKADDSSSDLALMGISIFVLCFTLGTNFDYRLIFLTATLPFLIKCYEAQPALERLVPPVVIVAFLWLSRLSSHLLYVDEIFDWVIFVFASMQLSRTLLLFRDASPHRMEAMGASYD